MCKKVVVLAVFLLFLLGGAVRFVNFPDRVNFGPEQALSLSLSSQYLRGDWSLLGLINVQRSTSNGLSLFSGSLFNYSLVPLIFLLGKDPVVLTACFALLNILIGLLIYLLTTKMTNQTIGFFAAAIFLFNDYMINHSLFVWILNYLPLLGILTIFLVYLYWSRRSSKTLPLILGIISGIGFNMEYVYLFTAIVVFAIVVSRSKNKILSAVLFVGGVFLANLPMVIFDLRHDYYHARTLFGYLEKVLNVPGEGKISYYHFLQFWPLLAIIAGLLLEKIYKKQKLLALVALVVYIAINLVSPRVSFSEALGMGDNSRSVVVKDLKKASQMIAEDNPNNFNVVFFPGADYRGYALRYFLEHIYKIHPNSVEQYPNSNTLYVFADRDFNYKQGYPWEVSSFYTQSSGEISERKIDEKYYLFKLIK